jgi:predicted transcriptional regulator
MKVGQFFNPNEWFYGAFIPNVLLRNPNLSASAKLLYARLAEYCRNGSVKCYPSHERLAEELGLSINRISQLIKQLVDAGFIVAIRPTGVDRLKHKTIRYKFLWHASFEEGSRSDIRDVEHNSDRTEELRNLVEERDFLGASGYPEEKIDEFCPIPRL